ncbi:RASSF7_8 [Mytilus edulis]|uniref:RASSF7_8 n=1 Tax=Mytilus edulis TaxID=6550 RepID=A0A8S3VRL2_MYTED|nr:RASSF7_8 [Mytilus edulis]
MLQHYKDQKHIEILQKKKDEAISKQQRLTDEIIKIKGEIDTYGGQWVSEKDMERALEKLSRTQKVDAVKKYTVYILQQKEERELRSKLKQRNFTLYTVMALNVLESNIIQISSYQEFDLKPDRVYKIYMAERNNYGIVIKPKTKNEVNRNLRNDGYTNDAMVFKSVITWSSGRYTDRNQLRRKVIFKMNCNTTTSLAPTWGLQVAKEI